MAGYRKNPPPRNIHTRDWTIGTRVEFSQSTATTHTIATPSAGHRIRLLGWSLTIAGAQTLTFTEDTAGDLSADYAFTAAGLWEPFLPFQQYETTTAGDAMKVTLSAAVAVAGDIWYEEIV